MLTFPRRTALLVIVVLLAGLVVSSDRLHGELASLVRWSERLIAQAPVAGMFIFVVITMLSAMVAFLLVSWPWRSASDCICCSCGEPVARQTWDECGQAGEDFTSAANVWAPRTPRRTDSRRSPQRDGLAREMKELPLC